MADGIKWLTDWDRDVCGVVFARGISAADLAVCMGGVPGTATEPITDSEVEHLGMRGPSYGVAGDGVVRVGTAGEWAFAVEYGDSTGVDRLEEISSASGEAIHYIPMSARPPARFHYAKDGVLTCGFGISEEHRRWGAEPDLLLSGFVAGQVLHPDGSKIFPPDNEPYATSHALTLSLLEQWFGLSLPRAALSEGRLPAYAVRGTPAMTTGREPDYQQIKTWAVNNGYTWEGTAQRVPPEIREAWGHLVRQDPEETA
ncbi:MULTISPECIES: DUF6461 domain-containing protein [unclassified Streptomyces]|uniref:DUF6461 domain-containing protein n=1 Tax=unclassified Streptomyces TaxID=2593676 RepID=UPI00380D2B5B